MWTIRDKRSCDLMPGNDKKEMKNQNNNNTTETNATAGCTVGSQKHSSLCNYRVV